VQEAVRNLETYLENEYNPIKLLKRATAPWQISYASELDDSTLSPDL